MEGQKKQLTTDKIISIGEYLPGTYSYSVTWNTELGSAKEERDIEILPNESNVLDGNLSMYEVELIKEDDVLYESVPVEIVGSTFPEFNFPKYEQKLEMEAAEQEAEREREYAKQEAELKIASLIGDYLTIYSYGYVNVLDTVISKDSVFFAQQTKYLQDLIDKDIQTEIGDFNIISLKETSIGSYTVTVDERYTIYKPNADPKEVKQKSIYTVNLINGNYYITGFKLG